MTETRIHSMSWSSGRVVSDSKWPTSFLFLGTETGCLIVYQISPISIKFVDKWEMVDGWLTNLLISPWIEQKGGEYQALISIGSSRNEVKVIPVEYHSDGEFILNMNLGTIALEPSRFSLSTQQWHVPQISANESCFILAVHRTFNLHVFYFNSNDFGCEASFRISTQFSAVASGLVIHSIIPTNDIVKILVMSCRGEVFSCDFDIRNQSVVDSLGSERILSSFVVKKKKSIDVTTVAGGISSNGPAINVEFSCFALVPHPHGNYMAVTYGLLQGDRLRYPINSQQVRRIAFLPMHRMSIDNASNVVPVVQPILRGSSVSSWWEARVLTKAISKADREIYISFLKRALAPITPINYQELENIGMDGKLSLSQKLEKVLFRSSVLDHQRMVDHLIDKSEEEGNDSQSYLPLSILSTIVLQHVAKNSNHMNFTDLDKAALCSYNHFVDVENQSIKYPMLSCSVSIKVPPSFEETFEFSDPATASSIDEITSENGHSWKRCSVTLLPLTNINVLTCGACNRKVIKKSELENVGELLTIILDTIDACIYCGGRFYDRG